jgi:hypothetical protein
VKEIRDYLAKQGLPTRDEGVELSDSPLRFPDGTACRIELPSSESPAAIEAALEEAEARGIRLGRMTQGSGVMYQTDDDLRRIAELSQRAGFEACMFIGPRGAWDVGSQAKSNGGGFLNNVLRGANGLVYGLEEIRRGCEFGLRAFLIPDYGMLSTVHQMRSDGFLPADLIVKASMTLAVSNPATARLVASLGATTINLPNDLTIGQIASIRAAVDLPLDLYVEGTDDQGAPVRYYDLPEIARVAAPIHIKIGIRNSAMVSPTGMHQSALIASLSRERVRRAELATEYLERYLPTHATGLRSR